MIATRRQVPVSSLLVGEIGKPVQQEVDNDRVRTRHPQVLEQGIDLGTYGSMTATRGELHERR